MKHDSLTRAAIRHTLHCLLGCSIGEILGMVISTALGWSNAANIVLSIGLAFTFGYGLTFRSVYKSKPNAGAALRTAVATDTTSIISMEAVDNIFILLVPGAINAGLKAGLFWWSLLVSLIAGVIIILAIRFFTYKTPAVHYHANFATFINGQQEKFKSPFYYAEESTASCSAEEKMTPIERAHMHDNVAGLVHVHDQAVTWGQFFQNIGWTVNNDLVQTLNKVYVVDKAHPVHFILNGHAILNPTSRVIGDQDRLAVVYGPVSQKALKSDFKRVPTSAVQADADKDPASCGGSAPTTTSQKLHHLF